MKWKVIGLAKIGIVPGSIRKNSFSKQLAENLAGLFPAGYETEFIDIANLPLYSQDSDENPPEIYTAFREKIKSLDAVLFVTPEHNRSIPAALKNALDIGSRPYGANVWNGKPAMIVSQTPGNLGGFGANHHLRQVLAFLNMPVVQQPEAYVSNVHQLLGDSGKITDPDTIKFLQSLVDAFVALIKKHQA